MIRATYELEPPGSAQALALEVSLGLPGGDPAFAAQVVEDRDGTVVLEVPAHVWGPNVPLLVAALVAGEATEAGAFTRCRLVDLSLPAGLLPGPAVGAGAGWAVGVIVKPAVGLGPAGVAEVVRAATAGGATFVKDDEKMGDVAWCPLEERVKAVADVLPPGVTYCANVTGPTASLLDRAARAAGLGATGLMVDAFTQGLDAVVALREAGLGVPVLAHRVGSGPWTRGRHFGVAGAVLARLTRLCGADYAIAGAFGGKMFDTEAEVDATLRALREPVDGARASWALLGGGVGAAGARAQVERAGGGGLVVLLGSRAYGGPGGLEAHVARTVEALA